MQSKQTPIEHHQNGWIEVICGSMFSGKTEELIRRLKRVEFANQTYILFKPKTDNRHSGAAIKSHQGSLLNGVVIEKSSDVFRYVTSQNVVAFDEVQFFDENIVEVVTQLADRGFRVVCAGLDMDFQRNPFGPMPQLLAIAEYVKKIHAICSKCGNLAYISHRTAKGTEQVMVGAIEKYKPLCRSCYKDVR